MQRLWKSEKGFTLVELLIVILILGLLAAIALPKFMDLREDAKKGTCKTTMASIDTALEQYAYYLSQDSTLDPIVTEGSTQGAGDLTLLYGDGFTYHYTDSSGSTQTKSVVLLKQTPTCPESGTYSVAVDTGIVSCSVHGSLSNSSSSSSGS